MPAILDNLRSQREGIDLKPACESTSTACSWGYRAAKAARRQTRQVTFDRELVAEVNLPMQNVLSDFLDEQLAGEVGAGLRRRGVSQSEDTSEVLFTWSLKMAPSATWCWRILWRGDAPKPAAVARRCLLLWGSV